MSIRSILLSMLAQLAEQLTLNQAYRTVKQGYNLPACYRFVIAGGGLPQGQVFIDARMLDTLL